MANSLKSKVFIKADKEMQECLVLTTSPSPEVASALARRLVEAELAACVNVIPCIQSHYQWNGAMACESEHLLLIKTHEARLSELELLIKALVPYEIPEFLILPLKGGSDDYLAWMRKGLGLEVGI